LRQVPPVQLLLSGRVLSRSLAAIVLGLVVLGAPAAWAESVCYDEALYPSVVRLDQTPTGLRALLGGKAGDHTVPSRRLPALKYAEAGGWTLDGPFECKEPNGCDRRSTRPGSPAPAIALSKPEAVALRPELKHAEEIAQEIGAWTEHSGTIWFGISFYDGEGTSGVGGIGRHDPKTGVTIVRRPNVIRDSSIDHIAHDGQWLWLATTGFYECSGRPPTHGLARYDWNADRLDTFEGRDDGPCGFVVHDLVSDAKYLWVATDLGLSRRDRRAQRWEHFVPDMAANPPMRSTMCEALYTSLLKTLPRAPLDIGSYYSQLFKALKRFRPRFLRTYVTALRPAEWGCDELEFLAARVPDYATLKATVLRFHPIGSPDIFCALSVFGEKNTREPEWRDTLLALLETSSFPRQLETLDLLRPFAGDAKVGGVLMHRLKTTPNPWREAELLPAIIGNSSVPVLFEALDRFKDGQRHIVLSIVVGLMSATHIAITPDGTMTTLGAGADPEVCDIVGCPLRDDAVTRVANHWRRWWEAHKREYGVRGQ